MNSGRLRHRITIQEKINILNDYGEQVDQWVDKFKRWADVRQMGGVELEKADKVQAEYDYKIKIRTSDITPDNRILHKNKIFAVISMEQDRTEKRYMILKCKGLEL